MGNRRKRGKKGGGDPRRDHFTDKARADGYAARSVFKLAEIDRRFKVFRPGAAVLDLGCHPGSWTQYAAERVGKQGRVVGIDRTPTESPADNTQMLQADLTDPFDDDALPGPFDVVLSDMAPDTTGIRHVDQDRSSVLAEIALAFAEKWGKPGSFFIVKVFQGPDFQDFLARVRRAYAKVRCVRPEATRKQSIEVYVVAAGKREPQQQET